MTPDCRQPAISGNGGWPGATPCRLVVFDFDGTLADSFPWFTGVLNEVAELYGFRTVEAGEMEAGEMEALRGCRSREILRRLEVPLWRLPWIARHMRLRMAQYIGGITLFPGAEATLRRLAEAGVTIAIVTSNARENVQRVLGPVNAGLITHVECGASLFGKAARIGKLLRRSGLTATDAIGIGDETRDVEAARACGIRCGAVSWGYAARSALEAERPDLLFDRFEDITAALLPPAGGRVQVPSRGHRAASP